MSASVQPRLCWPATLLPRWGAPGDDLAPVDRPGKRGALQLHWHHRRTDVAVQASVATGALASLGPDAGSGLAVRAALIVVLLAAASGAWWVANRRAARFRPAMDHLLPGRSPAPVEALKSTDLSRDLGARGTFVQFSSATCATCPQVRRVLSELVAAQPGVVHVELQSEDHMDLVRRFSVFRTPTVLLLNPDGAIHSRASGPLTPARALAALAQLSPATSRSINV
jgi:thiol-disulfide isomerase/thioredoxin